MEEELSLFNYASGRDAKPESEPERRKDGSGRSPSASERSEERQVITVSQLTRRIRGVLQDAFGTLWVEGEISNLRRQASGHQYFTLKDEGSQIACVLFRGDAHRARVELADGQQVQVYGELSVYEPRGNYQLIVRKVRARGEGGLQAQFEALKKKLHAEGLFDEEGKRGIPAFPRTVCIVTSPTGAAVRDMLNVLRRRAPWVRVLVYPVRVQGSEAPGEIVAALEDIAAENGRGLPEIDTVVLARGGGSLEDLWGFNEEAVARAIHGFPLPVVSAVGHEIDFTIADFVADLRAPTPSAAAELVAPDGEALLLRLADLGRALDRRACRALDEWDSRLAEMGRGVLVREPARILDEHEQALDLFGEQLRSRTEGCLGSMVADLREREHALAMLHPERWLEQQSQALVLLRERMVSLAERRLVRCEENVERVAAMLRSLGPEAVFARGFSVTLDAEGHVVSSADAVSAGDRIRTKLADGEIESVVE